MKIAAVILLALPLLVSSTNAATTPTTASQLTKRFKQATGEQLVLNKLRSVPGRYRAYDLGAQSIARKARWGTFTVYLVTAGDPEAEVRRLLSSAHTGVLGRPSAGNIYWESGTTLYGDKYWMAKRRYGSNIVLTWVGATAERKIDASFKRLHAALTFATRG